MDDLEVLIYDLDYQIPAVIRNFRPYRKLYKYATKIKNELITVMKKREH